MSLKGFNTDKDYYPIVLISNELSKFLRNETTTNQILSYLNIAIPEFDPTIKATFSKDKFNYLLDEYKSIEEFKTKFPYIEVTTVRDTGLLRPTIMYTVTDSDYFATKDNSSPYYIDKQKLPSKPLNYYEVTKKSKDLGTIILLVVLSSFVLLLLYKFNFVLFALLLAFITYKSFQILPELNNYNVEKINKKTEEYEKELIEFKQKIETIRENVRSDYIEKELILAKIAEENKSIVEPKILLDKLKPEVFTIKKNNNDSRGRSEIFFLTKLYDVFKTQVQVDVIPDIGKNPFQPDIVLICNETGYHIDIEIDEPYSVDNGKPIHHDRSNDEERNRFFLDLNWAVIRFSEKQIIENKDECIELIQNVLFAIRNKKSTFQNNVPRSKKWSYEEALIMSNSNYRNNYLPNNMKINIKFKKTNNYSENDDLPF
jgi:hypothetical protein